MRLPRRVAAAAGTLYRWYYRSLRIRVRLPDGTVRRVADYRFGSEVFALCEGDAATLAGSMLGRRFAVLVDHGRDGDWASAGLEAVGVRVVRGSSRQGGRSALRGLLRELDHDVSLGIVVDGPLGPAGRAKPGAVVCAILRRRPLRAVAAAARPAFVFRRSWSRLYLPWPFARVAIAVGDPLVSGGPLPRGRVAAVQAQVTEQLATLRDVATRLLAEQPAYWRASR